MAGALDALARELGLLSQVDDGVDGRAAPALPHHVLRCHLLARVRLPSCPPGSRAAAATTAASPCRASEEDAGEKERERPGIASGEVAGVVGGGSVGWEGDEG